MRNATIVFTMLVALGNWVSASEFNINLEVEVKHSREPFTAVLLHHQLLEPYIEHGRAPFSVKFSQLPPGHYLLRVRLESGRIITTTVNASESREGCGDALKVTLDARGGNISQEQLARAHAVSVRDLQIPREAREHYRESFKCMKDGEWEEAAKELNKAAGIAPEFVQAWTNLGVVQRRLGDLDSAEESFRNAFELEPESFNSNANMAALLGSRNRLEEAYLLAKRAYRIRPRDVMSNV